MGITFTIALTIALGATFTIKWNLLYLSLLPFAQGLFAWMAGEKVERGEQVSYKNEVR